MNKMTPWRYGLLLAATLALPASGRSATVTLNASDTGSAASFSTAGNWSGGAAPSAGNSYVVVGKTIRTAADSTSRTFAGDALTLSGGSQLLIKGTATGKTQTIGNLTLDGASITQNVAAGFSETVTGGITLGGGNGGLVVAVTPTSAAQTARLTVSSAIGGAGGLTIANMNSGGSYLAASADIITLSGANAYAGGTLVGTTANAQPVVLEVLAGGTTGSGSVTVLGAANASAPNATLKLGSATALDPDCTLTLGNAGQTNWALNLNYTGVCSVGEIVINGVSQTAGVTIGGSGSGANQTWPQISGTGLLMVGGPPQPDLQTTFGDDFDSYALGSSPAAFTLGSNGTSVNSWTVNSLHQLQGTVSNITGAGGAFGGAMRGTPFVGGSNRKDFTYTSQVKVTSSSAAAFQVGLVALAQGQPYHVNKDYYYAGMTNGGTIFLRNNNTSTAGLVLGAPVNLGVPMAVGTTYTFSLQGVYSGTSLVLNFSVTDGTHTASISGLAATPLTGGNFGYQVNAPTASSSVSAAFDEFDIDVPMGHFTMTLDDEFSGSALDTSVWSTGWRWGDVMTVNHEIQGYVPENVTVANGVCTLKTEKRHVQNTITLNGNPRGYQGQWMDYASGAIQTYNKWTQTYGYFEARIKMPSGKGTWPAFWMLPDRGSSWTNTTQRVTVGNVADGVSIPMGNEIDITEYMGVWKNPSTGLSQSHSGYIWNYSGGASGDFARDTDGFGGQLFYPDADTDFHTYGVYWAPNLMVFYLDGKPVKTWTSATTVSVTPEYLLLNCAVRADDPWHGGATTSLPDIDATLPSYTVIDYVRVWSLDQ